MSKVFYKFASQQQHSTIIFDGLSISVYDVKREILLQQKLDGRDYDLEIKDAASEEIYMKDSDLIQRNASLIVRRVPVKAQYAASRYLVGIAVQQQEPTSQNLAAQLPAFTIPSQQKTSSIPGLSNSAPIAPVQQNANQFYGETEEDRIKAFHAQSGAQWETNQGPQQQFQRKQFDASKPPPANYTCHRCGVKGHYINNCPTWDNQAFDNIRVKKTTGIPRSFLKTIGNVGGVGGDQDATPLDSSRLEELGAKSIMVTPYGDVVIAQVNDQLFNQHMQVAGSVVLGEDALREKCVELERNKIKEPGYFMPPDLVCDIDHVLFRDAVQMECCRHKYCYQCINDLLTQQAQRNRGQMQCPSCEKLATLESLVTSKPTRALVDKHLRSVGEYVQQHNAPPPQATQQQQQNTLIKQVVAIAPPPDANLSQQVAANYGEIQRLKFEPKFELNGDLLTVMDNTDDRTRIYDNKYNERLCYELQRCCKLMCNLSVPPAPAYRAREWERPPPTWGLVPWDREVTDPDNFVIKIAGQDEEDDVHTALNDRKRSRDGRDHRSLSRRSESRRSDEKDDTYRSSRTRSRSPHNGYRESSSRHGSRSYREDRYREERYKDDRYRDDRYTDDRYRNDKHKDDRYEEDSYRSRGDDRRGIGSSYKDDYYRSEDRSRREERSYAKSSRSSEREGKRYRR